MVTVRVVLALAFVAGTAWGEGVYEEFDQVVVNPPGSIAITELSVENGLGDVRIEGYDGEAILVNAKKKSRDKRALKRLTVGLTPRDNGAVSIATELQAGPEARPVPAGSVGIDLVIQVPRRTKPVVRVWKGSVFIEGVDNGADISGNEADVNVRHVSGSIASHVSSGRQQFWELVGANVMASAVHGDVSLDTVSGDSVEAWAHTGLLTARRLHVKRLSLRTVRGDIRVHGTLLPRGRYEILSHHGNVEFVAAKRFPVRLAARSQSGRVRLPDEFRARMAADVAPVLFKGQGESEAAALTIQSRHGDVHVSLHFDF